MALSINDDDDIKNRSGFLVISCVVALITLRIMLQSNQCKDINGTNRRYFSQNCTPHLYQDQIREKVWQLEIEDMILFFNQVFLLLKYVLLE